MLFVYTVTATDVLNDIAWSAVLDDTFYNNYMNDSSLTWQYFASHSGFFRNYPGACLDIWYAITIPSVVQKRHMNRLFTARRNACIESAVLAIAIPSVYLSVRHTPVLCQNDGT